MIDPRFREQRDIGRTIGVGLPEMPELNSTGRNVRHDQTPNKLVGISRVFDMPDVQVVGHFIEKFLLVESLRKRMRVGQEFIGIGNRKTVKGTFIIQGDDERTFAVVKLRYRQLCIYFPALAQQQCGDFGFGHDKRHFLSRIAPRTFILYSHKK